MYKSVSLKYEPPRNRFKFLCQTLSPNPLSRHADLYQETLDTNFKDKI